MNNHLYTIIPPELEESIYEEEYHLEDDPYLIMKYEDEFFKRQEQDYMDFLFEEEML